MDEKIGLKFASYPDNVKEKLLSVRELILKTADSINAGKVIEDLKWGQLSYSTVKGSPIRIDWSKNHPDKLSIFFNCKTTLVDTFKEIYSNEFEFKGNRELVLPLNSDEVTSPLAHCLSMALEYHKIKKLPLLGA